MGKAEGIEVPVVGEETFYDLVGDSRRVIGPCTPFTGDTAPETRA